MKLLDYYLILFSQTLGMLKNPEESAETLRKTLMGTYEEVIHQISKSNYTRNDISYASAATFICLDEIILCSGHTLTRDWRKNLLQNDVSGVGAGGVSFFEWLGSINDDNDELRVLYLFCLLIGYKGRYAGTEEFLLDKIIGEQFQKLPSEYMSCFRNDETQAWNITSPYEEQRKQKVSIFFCFSVASVFIYLFLNLLLIV